MRQTGLPLSFARARGAYLYDAAGRELIDYHAAFGPVVLGHCHEAVDRAVAATLGQIDLVGVGTHELEVRLAQEIVRHVPSAEQALLCVTGTEATSHAVRLARAVTGRRKVLKFQGCFHGGGDSLLLNVITPAERLGMADPGSAGILPEVLAETLVADFNDLEGVARLLAGHRGQVAAVILEPVPHNIGCLLPRPGFLEGLRALTREHGALLIFDEVITGFRHGLGGYQGHCGVTPDLTALGKAMANGYPVAAFCRAGAT